MFYKLILKFIRLDLNFVFNIHDTLGIKHLTRLHLRYINLDQAYPRIGLIQVDVPKWSHNI